MHGFLVWIQTVLVPTLGPLGLFVVAFVDSSFLSVPEINDVLVVTAAAADASTAWVYVLSSTLGSLAGCSALWYLGRRGGEAVLVRRFGRERVERTRIAFERWDILTLAIPAVLPPPMPFKIFVLSAGVFGFPWRRFALTLVIARGARYTFWAVLGGLYGDQALALLRRFDEWSSENALILLVGCGLLVAAGVAAYYARGKSETGGGAPLL